MLKRLLSLILILAMLCSVLPAAIAEEAAPAEDAVAEDVSADRAADLSGTAAVMPDFFKRGDRDNEDSSFIVVIQNRLIELGYLNDAADGVYGLNTEEAVRALQQVNGLPVTGNVDSKLMEKILSGAELEAAPEPIDSESAIYRLQEKFALWGFLYGKPDGKAGKNTTAAVTEFKQYLRDYQKAAVNAVPTPDPAQSTGFGDAAIAVDAPIERTPTGEITQDVMDYVDGAKDFDVYYKTVSSGDEGDDVLRIQRRLRVLNYLYTIDGIFGSSTERALLYFQKKNGLPQSAVADETTQRMLFSEAAAKSEEYINAYKMIVDVSDQKVYVYQWNGSDYSHCVGEMICSTGTKEHPTPLGVYQAAGTTGLDEWYWFEEHKCYARWATRIVGGILFHSVIYSKGKVLNRTSLNNLGKRASHGCVRLQVEHAKWMYENCTSGTTVIIQE